MRTIVAALVAFGAAAALAPLVLGILRREDVLDHPSGRSSHTVPVPRGGGVALGVGALLALTLTPSVPAAHRVQVAGAAALFGAVGLFEDLVGIPPLRRLGAQFVVAASVVLFGSLPGHAPWSQVFAVAAVFWVVGFVNAYNFMDGIDGISVAQAVAAGAVWFAVGTHAHVPTLAAGGAVAAGAALGFAPYNLPRARMFLGDVGSYFMGAWLGTVALLGVRAGVPAEAVLAPLALYVADTGSTLIRRVARGEAWYLPHRDHTYQRLHASGWSHVQASALVGACITACGMLGAVSLGHSVPLRVAADVAIAGVVGAYLFAPRGLAGRRAKVAVA